MPPLAATRAAGRTNAIPAGRVFTTGQVARICLVAPRTVSKWFDSGRLRGYRMPGSEDRRVPRAQLIRFLKESGMPYTAEDLATPRVLVVTDDDILAGAVAGPLDPDLVEAARARNGFEAGVLCASPVAACVIDFAMGRSESLSLAAGVRSRWPEALLVALANEDETEGLTAWGFAATFRRPCDLVAVSELLVARLGVA